VDVGLFYFMAYIFELARFSPEDNRDFELSVGNDGSVRIRELDGEFLMVITDVVWEDLVKFVKRQQKNI